MSERPEAPDWARDRMLESLDDLRRRIETGEIVGIMTFAERTDGYVYTRRAGLPPGAVALVILRNYVREGEIDFLERSMEDDDGEPHIEAVEDDTGSRLGVPKRISKDQPSEVPQPDAVPGVPGDGDGDLQVVREEASSDETESDDVS